MELIDFCFDKIMYYAMAFIIFVFIFHCAAVYIVYLFIYSVFYLLYYGVYYFLVFIVITT
jgi:hypothetical protein